MKLRAPPLSLILWAALAALAWSSVRQCNRADGAEQTVAAQAERAEVEARNVATAKAVTREGFDRMINDARERLRAEVGKSTHLEAEVSRLLMAAEGAHVTEVSHGDTGWIPTGAPPVSGGAPEGGGGPDSSPASPPPRVCRLSEGDEGRITTDQVRARYEHGTVGVVGVADAFGRAPGGEPRHLFGAPLKLDLVVEGAPRAPGWVYGLGGGASLHGGLGAILIQTPPVRIPLLGWPARAWLLGAGGASEGLILAGVSVEP